MSAPDSGAVLKALAHAMDLQQRGRLDEAEGVYARLIADNGRDPTALINGGVLATVRGDVATALARLGKAAEVVPHNAVAHANLGYAMVQAGRDAEALAALERAVALKPDFAQAHNNRGIALTRLRRADEARAAFVRALECAPVFGEAAINLGEACNRAGDISAARAAFARVRPGDPRALFAALGLAFAGALDGRLDEAMAALAALAREHPREAAVWHTLGAVRNWAWRHDDAEAAFRRALDLAPQHSDARFGLAFALLARGRYDVGFAAFEAARAGFAPPPALRTLPRWNGEPLEGTLVVHGEQGLGDVLMFARFVPQLRARVGRIVLLLDGYWRPLAPLLASLHGVDAVLGDTEAALAARPAARASMLSLALHAQARPDTLPLPPYLAVPPDRREAWARRVAALTGRRVGLAWSVHARDDHAYVSLHKSVPPGALAPLFDVDGVSFVSLQPGAEGDPAGFGRHADRIAPLAREVRDFADTAALIGALDAVVTADTAVAHLAGALGKPFALLERFHGCWRWRLAPDTSPWYPSARICRQKFFGDWTGPVERAAAWLAA